MSNCKLLVTYRALGLFSFGNHDIYLFMDVLHSLIFLFGFVSISYYFVFFQPSRGLLERAVGDFTTLHFLEIICNTLIVQH